MRPARALAALTLAALALVAGCTPPAAGPVDPGLGPPGPGASTGSPSPGRPDRPPSASQSAAPTLEVAPEPTTTNTLPAPAAPTTPEPRTSGPLTARSLPIPDGWRTVVREGGPEDGYQGNGSWTHGRDPRYAAQDAITVGCAPVTRDDYPDPTAALEGTYENAGGAPGVGLVLQFSSRSDATAFWRIYRAQVGGCDDPDGPVLITVQQSTDRLVNRRTYPDGDWTEVGMVIDDRVSLVALSDPGHRIGRGQVDALTEAISAASRR